MKYEITNQLTGLAESASTFEDAKILQQRLINEYLASIAGVFQITAMVDNDDGSVTQVAVDELGNPVPVLSNSLGEDADFVPFEDEQ